MEDAARLSGRGAIRAGRRAAAAGRAARALAAAAGLAACALAATATAQEPAAADSARWLAASAREAAGRDDHAAALRDAAAAIALDPALERELDLLVAHQLTWSDRPAEAIPWFRRRLARVPDDTEARIGLARAISWTGDLDAARAEYAALLADDPDNLEAALGVARMHAWADDAPGASRAYVAALARDPASAEAQRGLADAENRRGLHRRAEALYRARLEDDPEDEDARVGLARARAWMGEEDSALRTLEGAGTPAADDLRRSILADRGTVVELSYSHWKDRDDQTLDTIGLAASRGFGGGRRGVVHLAKGTADEPGTPSIDALRADAGGDWRPNRNLSFQARAGILDIGRNLRRDDVVPAGDGETRDGDDVKRAVLVWDAWVTITPRDRVRFDLAHARVPIETPRALARAIRADVFGLGADITVTDRWVLRGSGSVTGYTDDNTRVAGSAEVEHGPYRLPADIRIRASGGASAFRFDESEDHGYYSPETYDALWLGARAALEVGSRVSFAGDVRLASEREEEEDRFGVLNGGLEARAALRSGFGIAAFVRSSTSRFDSGAGYERDGWGVSLFHAP